MNLCDAGHKHHSHIEVMTDIGKMTVYDSIKYMGYKGYCTGQDDVSMTLQTVGTWDLPIKNLIMKLLTKEGQVFFDVGSHVGYFSKLAENLGAKVYAFEAESESLEMLKENVPSAETTTIWFDEKTPPKEFPLDFHVDVMKIDIEGSERYAVLYFSKLLLSRSVDHIIIEVSPTFNDSYPQLLKDFQSTGYLILNLDGSPFIWDFNFIQTNLWLKKI